MQDINPLHINTIVIQAMQQFREYLQEGALISIDDKGPKVRILPLNE